MVSDSNHGIVAHHVDGVIRFVHVDITQFVFAVRPSHVTVVSGV